MSLQKSTITFIKEALKDNKIRKVILQDGLQIETEYRKKQKEYNKKYYHAFRKVEKKEKENETEDNPLMSELRLESHGLEENEDIYFPDEKSSKPDEKFQESQ
jgi:hypothetical protein